MRKYVVPPGAPHAKRGGAWTSWTSGTDWLRKLIGEPALGAGVNRDLFGGGGASLCLGALVSG